MTSRQIQFLVGLLIIVAIGIGLVVVADVNRQKLAARMEAEKAAALIDARDSDAGQQAKQDKQAAGETADAATGAAAGKPSFDVARFEPTGDGVLAGLAKPGAIVELLADGEPIASTTANEVGEWVIVLDSPLAAGSHDLAVRATVPEGEPALSEDFIAVVVPDSPSGEVLVVASRPGQASEIIARPSATDNTGTAGAGAGSAQQPAAAVTGEAVEGAQETQIAAADAEAAPDAGMDKPADQAVAKTDPAADAAPQAAVTEEIPESAAEPVDTAAVMDPAADAAAIADQTTGETAAGDAASQSVAEETVASIADAPESSAVTEATDEQSAPAATTDNAAAEAVSESTEAAAAPVEDQPAEAPSEQVALADNAPESAEPASNAGQASSAPAVSGTEQAAQADAAMPETNVAAVAAADAVAPSDQPAAGAPEEQQPVAAEAEAEPEPMAEKPKAEFKLALDAVETEGRMVYAAGTGNPGALVRVYADDTFIGETSANEDGRWLLETSAEIAAGNVVVRADELASGSVDVVRRAEVPFFKQADAIALLPTTATGSGGASGAAAGVAVTGPKSVIIRSGDNLWTISRRTYGRGIRYTTIYKANDDQIRNPHMIFPGQVFVLPEGDKTWTQ